MPEYCLPIWYGLPEWDELEGGLWSGPTLCMLNCKALVFSLEYGSLSGCEEEYLERVEGCTSLWKMGRWVTLTVSIA
jgi:hypothetical protein